MRPQETPRGIRGGGIPLGETAMKSCTINIPDIYLDDLEVMKHFGYFPSMSAAIRYALKVFLQKEAVLNEDLEVDRFTQLKHTQVEALVR